MVGSRDDRQEEQTRVGAEQLSATLLVIEDMGEYGHVQNERVKLLSTGYMNQLVNWKCGINRHFVSVNN